MAALQARAKARVAGEDGFGLIELSIAMVMLSIALLALVAALSSGIVTLQRAGATGTAGTLADRQMERYRALKYTTIMLDATAQTTANADSVYSGETSVAGSGAQVTGTCTGPGSFPDYCKPRQTSVTGPDNRLYRVDTYIYYDTPTGTYTGRQLKLVTVVVRDPNRLTGPPLAKVQTRFDQATGQ
ncbi:MAG: prepilin-type N-terminal cleavage/methylation domain-containing protein [Gaiellaceae bacterium]